VEFLRTCRPGTVRAVGEVVRRTRRVVFCAAQLYDADGVVLATARCTQVVLPADGHAGRYEGVPER
jgi:acyl-coenzyme A thioesterase PaaI-like protein